MPTLYRKYRPKTFSEIVGQSHVVRTLTNAIEHKRIGHAYLLTGPRGTGKTTLARIFAKTINCLDQKKNKNGEIKIEPCNKCKHCEMLLSSKAIDLVEIDAASHTGVDNIRQLKESIVLPPTTFKFKVYIIDEVHMLSAGAFNALLKTLEEPPAHALFILATTELHKVPDTIISRCQRFDISHLSQDQIIQRLTQIAQSEKVEIEKEALETIAIEAEGGMRDAESLLGQIISLEDKSITAQEVHDILGTSSKRVVREFSQLLANKDIVQILSQIDQLQNEGINLKNFNKSLLTFFRSLVIIKTCNKSAKKILASFSSEQLVHAQDIAEQISLTDIVQMIELLQKSLAGFKETSIPQLPLEMAAIEFCLDDLGNEQIQKSHIENPKQQPTAQQDIKQENDAPKKVLQQMQKNDKPQVSEEQPEEPDQQDSGDGKLPPLENILEKWSQIIKDVKPHNHSIHAFLENCTPCGIKENTLYIKTKYDFYKDKLSESSNRLTVQKVVAKIIGTALKITFITESECKAMDFPKNRSPKKANVLHDAMKVFGGKITKK